MSSKERVVDPRLKDLFDQMPGLWGCKDENSVFMYGNAECGKALGLAHHEDIIGMTDFDVPCESAQCAHLFQAQDQQVIKTATTMRVLDIHPFAGGEWRVYIFTKAPMWNDQEELIGTIYHGQDITSTTAMEIGSLLTRASVADVGSDILGQSSYILGTQFSDLKLTDRQSEVLFYLLRGKTVKQIGLLLGISYRTVDEYMEQLKHKFGAMNKHELIDKAISFGFLNTIPEKLFRTQLSVELKDG